MKTSIFLAFFCSFFLFTGTTIGQPDFLLKFKVWKNSASAANYLGEYHFNAGHPQNFGNSIPLSLAEQLCPGDRLILEKEVQGQDHIEIDLSTENSGLYIIQVSHGDDKVIQKIIKQ